MVPTGQKQNAASKRKEGMDIISGVEIGDPKKIEGFPLAAISRRFLNLPCQKP